MSACWTRFEGGRYVVKDARHGRAEATGNRPTGQGNRPTGWQQPTGPQGRQLAKGDERTGRAERPAGHVAGGVVAGDDPGAAREAGGLVGLVVGAGLGEVPASVAGAAAVVVLFEGGPVARRVDPGGPMVGVPGGPGLSGAYQEFGPTPPAASARARTWESAAPFPIARVALGRCSDE